MTERPSSPPRRPEGILALGAALFFFTAGGSALSKGVWDATAGRPEARFFSLDVWGVVTRGQWARFAFFEVCFGLACVAVGRALWRWARTPPERVHRS